MATDDLHRLAEPGLGPEPGDARERAATHRMPNSHHEWISIPAKATARAIESSKRRERVARHAQDDVRHGVERARADRLAAVVEQHPFGRSSCALVTGQPILPERMAAGDGRDDGEVVGRRRRGGRPFQRRRVPRIRPGRRAAPQAAPDVDQRTAARRARTRRRRRVITMLSDVPAQSGRIGVDAPRHAEQAGDVHREERRR